MHTNHNRIKVSDLETDHPDKILVTNSKGELEFIPTKNIKVDSYNALDYDQEGKALDARQGKILKDLVNNKTDKGGFQGTAQDLVNSIPDLNAANLKFGGYPNTRNDGQLPTNKILSTDENGNLKLYTMPISPAPYIAELIPDSYLPDTTGNIKIIGDFFTPSMCDRINNPNAIIIGGVVAIHYATFISSQELLVNVTTGSIEGSFPATLDNGLSTTKLNSLLIVLGTIYSPKSSDWINKSGVSNTDTDGEIRVETFKSSGYATWDKEIDFNNDWELRWNTFQSPLGTELVNPNPQYLFLKSVLNGNVNVTLWFWTVHVINIYNNNVDRGMFGNANPKFPKYWKLRYINKVLYLYGDNNYLIYTFETNPFTENVKAEFLVYTYDYLDIKYIELAK